MRNTETSGEEHSTIAKIGHAIGKILGGIIIFFVAISVALSKIIMSYMAKQWEDKPVRKKRSSNKKRKTKK